ncbi:MAG TPA: universal stress protein [Planctomycetaceae bacterium]|nr:universal stress protein [Planctomycetaceae bacterium]
MPSFRKILVGVDLSHGDRLASKDLPAPMREAVRRGIWLAERGRGEVTFVSVFNVSANTLVQLEDEHRKHLHSQFEKVAEEVLAELIREAEAKGVRAQSKLAFGDPSVEITREVLREKHDMLVLAARESSALRRMLFGGAALRLFRKCPCPVWVARHADDNDLHNVLVATDLSETGQDALRAGVTIAQESGARLHVLHVVESPIDQGWASTLPEETASKYHEQVHSSAREELREQLDRTDYRAIPAGVEVSVSDSYGGPDTAILDYIQERRIDLLVMGTSGRSGVSALFMGNTAERLIPEVPCSVLMLKPHGFESPIKLD